MISLPLPRPCQALALVLLALSAKAAPLPQEIRQAAGEVARWEPAQSRQPAFLLEQFVPRATGDAQQRQELAALLLQRVTAADITAEGRTILCQHLSLVAGDAELPVLRKLLENPATAADARIALGAVGGVAVGTPLPAEAKEAYLARISDPNPAVRLTALSSLAWFYPEAAIPPLVQAMGDEAPIVSATAIRQLGRMDGGALAAHLPKLDAPRQGIALEVLAQHKVKAAAPAISALATSGVALVRPAAIAALGAVGDAASVPILARIATEEEPQGQTAAANALAELSTPGVDEAILREMSQGAPAVRAIMINAVAQRSSPGALPHLIAAARDSDSAVQSAALKALARLGKADLYPPLVELLAPVRNPLLETAVATVGRRVESAPGRVAPLVALLGRGDLSAEAQASVLRTLALTGGPEALQAVRERLGQPQAAEAAVRALADWPGPEALDDLFRLAEQSPVTLHRALALRGLLRLTPKSSQAVPCLRRARPILKTTAEKRLWLSALSELKEPAALALAEEMLSEVDVAAEARLAMDKIDAALGGRSKYAEARRAALAKTLPAGAKLVAYVDCGGEVQDRSGSVRLRVTRGNHWTFHGQGDPSALTVAFSGGQVDCEAGGLDPKKCYSLGFTWWDCDSNGRAQSVWAGGQKLLEKTALPSGPQGPAQMSRPIPSAVIRDGKVTVEFRKEAAANAVVSEIWLVESANSLPATAAIPAPPAPKPVEIGPVAVPVVKANPGAAKKVLLVTGVELHKWQETAPLLVAAIGGDPRLEVSVVEDPRFLASPDLKHYDTVVLNYQNHQVPAPDGALANLKQAVEGGKGLVLVHFACGAFIDWQTRTVDKDFLAIAGRVWNPKLRGHDPRGSFRVRIIGEVHLITKGLADFETEDELYTCLDGGEPVQLLAVATSKVDGKDYPMVFLGMPGKGRTFHCALGHGGKSFGPTVQQLYRRGTAWASGLEP